MTVLSRRQFSALFVLLAVCFVPVRIDFGVIGWTVPTCWGIVATLNELARLKWRHALGFAFYSACYVSIFYLSARILHFLMGLLQHDRTIRTLQAVVLAGLLGCSFCRVITYSSIQGRGGTYTFWTAVERYLERQSRR